MALPFTSITAVVTFTLYVTDGFCPLVVKVACDPEQLDNVHPGLSDVIFVVFTVAQSIFSLQLTITLLSGGTLVAESAGFVLLTVGTVLSRVIVLPAPGVSTLIVLSVALLLIV